MSDTRARLRYLWRHNRLALIAFAVALTVAGIAGETVWVGMYIGMGRATAGSLEAASDAIGNLLGFLGAGAAVLALGWWLVRSLRIAKA